MALARILGTCLVCLAISWPAPSRAAKLPAAALSDAPRAPELARKQRSRGAKKKARLKAEEEARLKAEEEARLKAEEEARLTAEEEARLTAEEEARLKAEEEARRKAEEEARRKAEEEARLKAEAEAAESVGLDVRVRRLTDALARGFKRLPGDVREQSFAVLPFTEVGEEAQQRQLGLVVSDLVITNLVAEHRVRLVERGQLRRILAEQELGASGAIDEARAPQLGQLTGARALVLGEVADLGDAFRVSARLVDGESGQVLLAEEQRLPKAELIAVSANAVVLKSRSGALFRSLVAPGWGQLYNGEPVKAGFVGGGVGLLALGTAATLGSAGLTHASYARFGAPQRDELLKAGRDPSVVIQELREAANVQYAAAALLGGATAAVWLAGALEAYLSGTDVESLDEALAAN